MIIVSQDKRDVLNFDFTQRIGLDRETDFTSIIAYQNGNAEAECLWLGSYVTEERAKEVLQEIASTYSKIGIVFDTFNGGQVQQLPIFEMPED